MDAPCRVRVGDADGGSLYIAVDGQAVISRGFCGLFPGSGFCASFWSAMIYLKKAQIRLLLSGSFLTSEKECHES